MVFDGARRDDPPVAERGDSVADRIEAAEIVRYHENREPQSLLQGCDQLVEVLRADGIEAGRRLVEEDDLRVERQRPGERDALDHAAGEFGRELVADVGLEADHLELEDGQLVHQPVATA